MHASPVKATWRVKSPRMHDENETAPGDQLQPIKGPANLITKAKLFYLLGGKRVQTRRVMGSSE